MISISYDFHNEYFKVYMVEQEKPEWRHQGMSFTLERVEGGCICMTMGLKFELPEL